MAAKKTQKGFTGAEKVGLGIGLTAAAVAAAGAYFLYGSKNAAQNRKKVKGWTLKAKGEVLEALEKAEKITQSEYLALVDAASGAYASVQKATKGEIRDFKSEMLEHWAKLQRNKDVKKVGGAVAKAVPKKAAPKKVAKKSGSKSAKKVA
jgi:hypothetical protein